MATVKTKSTCNACALAKVKCGREKPTCLRCKERGLRCLYDPSQRSGRRPAAKPIQPQFALQSPNDLADFSTDFQFENGLAFDADQSNSLWESTLSALTEANPTSGSNWSSTTATSVDDYFGDYSTDRQRRSSLSDDTDMSDLLDATGNSTELQLSFEFPDMSTHTPVIEGEDLTQWHIDPSITTDPQGIIDDAPEPKADDVGCHLRSRRHPCSVRLLNLLASLETKPSRPNETSVMRDQSNDNIAILLSRIAERNSAALGCVDEMLNCSCLMYDRQCLIVSLIVTKVLAWYGAVVAGKDSCDTPSNGGSEMFSTQEPWAAKSNNCQSMQGLTANTISNATSSYPLEDGGNTRMRAQLVLSELRHVLRTLNHWSQRHKEVARSADAKAGGLGGAMCVLIEVDLRNALQACSREAMNSLH